MFFSDWDLLELEDIVAADIRQKLVVNMALLWTMSSLA